MSSFELPAGEGVDLGIDLHAAATCFSDLGVGYFRRTNL